MYRRQFLLHTASYTFLAGMPLALGCRGKQYARVIEPGESQMVGSHQAGGETFGPLIDDAVAKLLARHCEIPTQTVSYQGELLPIPPKRICFIGVENKSAEEIGDFKEQIYQSIDSKVLESRVFQAVSRRYVDAGLFDTRLRPDQLFVPENMRTFTEYMEQQGHPFDYMMYATITSGTTRQNHEFQRDYLLTLELTNVATGEYDKQSAQISKGYHKSPIRRWTASNPFKLN